MPGHLTHDKGAKNIKCRKNYLQLIPLENFLVIDKNAFTKDSHEQRVTQSS